MNGKIRDVLVLILVVGTDLAFLASGAFVLYAAWQKGHHVPEQWVPTFTVLTGLVGGITAAGFGQPAEGRLGVPRLQRKLAGFSAFIFVEPTPPKEIMVGVYAASYFTAVAAAAITLFRFGGDTPEVVRNLALAGVGLILAIVQAYFNDTPKGRSLGAPGAD